MAEILVIGAGMGGLSSALLLAAAGHGVTVLERAATPGGKLREVAPGGRALDAGPTVFTMRWVLEEIFAQAGLSLAERLDLSPLPVLARHAWEDGSRLDLHADPEASAAAIAAFAGAREEAGFRRFLAAARAVHDALEGPFLRAPRPDPLTLSLRAGPRGVAALLGASPFRALWDALGGFFQDLRLRQLFGRYATYCGASPFLAPATLMLVAHVEQAGVWSVRGGMHRVAQALREAAASRGARFRFGAEAAALLSDGRRCTGLRLADGEAMRADAVVFNGDPEALRAGLLGPAGRAAMPGAPLPRSLSALTSGMVAEARGFPLSRHTVFFGPDYAEEFDAVFRRAVPPVTPTTYVCAQDRGDGDDPHGPERLLVLANAPARGAALSREEIDRCRTASLALMRRCGLTLRPLAEVETGPAGFAALFPGTEGALYGPATHGPWASFRRPAARTRLPGLYLAGGGAHPGAGVPMAALSGRIAAASLLSDLASSTIPRRTAMPGGTWTRSATTGGTG